MAYNPPPSRANSGPDPDLLSQVHIAVIRLDAKVDQLKDGQLEQNNKHLDHETRIRLLETKPHVPVERFVALESRDTVSTATLKWVVGFLISITGIAVTIVGLAMR